MSLAVAPYVVEERVICGEKPWIAIRARGAEWSWLTAEEAVIIGRAWLARYGQARTEGTVPSLDRAGPEQAVDSGYDPYSCL